MITLKSRFLIANPHSRDSNHHTWKSCNVFEHDVVQTLCIYNIGGSKLNNIFRCGSSMIKHIVLFQHQATPVLSILYMYCALWFHGDRKCGYIYIYSYVYMYYYLHSHSISSKPQINRAFLLPLHIFFHRDTGSSCSSLLTAGKLIVPGNGVVEESWCPGRFCAKLVEIIPSVSRSNFLHVDVFISVFFIEVYSIDSCKVIKNLLKGLGLKQSGLLVHRGPERFGAKSVEIPSVSKSNCLHVDICMILS
jgi:hypothetical protein